MKYTKVAILCATVVTAGFFWYYQKSHKGHVLSLTKRIQERQTIISQKISHIQDILHSDPNLDKNRKNLISEVLSNMALIDQEIREQAIHAGTEVNTINQLIAKVDEFNLEQLEKLLTLTKKEWFSISEFGKDADHNAWLIIQHAELETQQKFLSIIEKLAKKGESNLRRWATLYDRVSMGSGKPQKYGTQFIYRENTNFYELYEVEDIQNLGQNRANVGLPPLEEYTEKLKSAYKKPFKL